MGERTSHAPGTISWSDLGTTDPDAAKAFYTNLFGWEIEDLPIPDGGTYTMLRKDGKNAAALSAAQEGMPSLWNAYVTVESADDAAGKARGLGATVVAEPFDVMDAGRMAVIQDPTGAKYTYDSHGQIKHVEYARPALVSPHQVAQAVVMFDPWEHPTTAKANVIDVKIARIYAAHSLVPARQILDRTFQR